MSVFTVYCMLPIEIYILLTMEVNDNNDNKITQHRTHMLRASGSHHSNRVPLLPAASQSTQNTRTQIQITADSGN